MVDRMICVEAALPYVRWGEDGERDSDAGMVEYTFHLQDGCSYDAIHVKAAVGEYVVGKWYRVEWRKEPQPPRPSEDLRVFVSAEEC